MPSRLRPTAPFAADAILVGDPGRALLLAQELLEQPKMSNHARGLWGYSGRTPSGAELTIQATGMGGPSAALVLNDLAKLGVQRVVRIGTCTSIGGAALGELLLVERALAAGGSAGAFGLDFGAATQPDAQLLAALRPELDRQEVTIASLDTMATLSEVPTEAVAVDMQTVAVFACSRQLEIAAAAILIVNEADGKLLDDDALAAAASEAGQAARQGLI